MTTEKKENFDQIMRYVSTILVTLLISIMGFYVSRLYELVDKKVDKDVLTQYIVLSEERNALYLEMFRDNKTEHKEMMKKLEKMDEAIHELKEQLIGYITTRGDSEMWDFEALTLFMLENRVWDKMKKPKYVGLI